MKRIIYISLMAIVFSSCQKETTKSSQKSPLYEVKVKTENVSSASSNQALKYSGSIEAYKTIPMGFQIIGRVESIYVEEGQHLKKGQLLASLDKSDALNSYSISKAKKEQAEDAYSRLKKVYEQGSLTEIKWVEMQTNLSQAQSLARISKSNLDKCDLRSPMDGYVGRRNIEIGMSAMGLESPFEIVDIDKVLIKISVPENEIGIIEKGQRAKIMVRALNNEEFDGAVESIGIVANTFSRTYSAKILVENPNLKLKPGMVCDVNLNVSSDNESLVVSVKSIDVNQKGKPYVYVVDRNNKNAVKQFVDLGNYRGNKVEITEGLNEGDIIIIEGKEKLHGNFTLRF